MHLTPTNFVEYIGVHPRERYGMQAKWEPKKIEQEASNQCHYSEYLTLLTTSQDVTTRDRQACDEEEVREIVGSNPPND
jgi:hypothetical protein